MQYWKVKRIARFWLNHILELLGLKRTDAHWGGYWEIRHLDRFGNVLWEDAGRNMLHDEGEEYILSCAFDEVQSPPANFYIGLDNRSSLAEADTLASLVDEPSTNGYARQAVASDNTDITISQVSGDYQAKTKTVTFSASGGSWGPVTKIFWCTSADSSGKLIASKALSQSRTLSDGESLECSFYIRLSE